MSERRPLYGAALLLVSALVWGLAFVPQKHSVVALPPLTASAARFVFAAPVMLAFAGRRLLRPGLPVREALLLGTLLFVAYALQTVALTDAPVARVSLITGMYAVFVPLLAPWFGHRRPGALHWAGALLAVVGLLGLVGLLQDRKALTAPVTLGDFFVLLHALLGAVQVLIVGRIASRVDARVLNALQIVVIAVLAVPASLVLEGAWDLAIVFDRHTFLALAYLAVLSTGIGFMCQLLGQRHASPAAAAVIMLLESPIGVVAAMLAFHETMAWSQWAGAAVLLAGVGLSLFAEARRSSADAAAEPTAATVVADAATVVADAAARDGK